MTLNFLFILIELMLPGAIVSYCSSTDEKIYHFGPNIHKVGKYKIVGVCCLSLNIPKKSTSHCTIVQSGFISLKTLKWKFVNF